MPWTHWSPLVDAAGRRVESARRLAPDPPSRRVGWAQTRRVGASAGPRPAESARRLVPNPPSRRVCCCRVVALAPGRVGAYAVLPGRDAVCTPSVQLPVGPGIACSTPRRNFSRLPLWTTRFGVVHDPKLSVLDRRLRACSTRTPRSPAIGADAGAPAGVVDVRALDDHSVLSFVVAQRRSADQAEADLLAGVVHWADLHPVTPQPGTDHRYGDNSGAGDSDAATWPVDRPIGILAAIGPGGPGNQGCRLAGVGAPEVTEAAVVDLAAALGVSYRAGLQLVADTLELRYRLPRLWALVQTGTLAAWKARQVAAQTTHLSRPAALFVDRHLTVLARRGDLPPNKVRPLIHEALLQHDPDTAAGIEEAALTRRGVWFDHRDSTATTTLTGVLDTLDAIDLDHALGDIATQMKTLGDTDHLDTRRAHALGLLAHPQRALNLFTHPTTPPTPTATPTADTTRRDSRCRHTRRLDRRHTRRLDRHRHRRRRRRRRRDRVQAAAHAPTRPPVRSGVPAPRSTCTWTSPTSPPPPPQAHRMRRRCSSRRSCWSGGEARPREPAAPPGLVDPDRVARCRRHHPPRPRPGPHRPPHRPPHRRVDRHDPPEWMRELVILRDRHCVFPGCQVDARACDLDHINPYVPPETGGPPGQTHPDNLAALCRRHHRAKTHRAWTYRRRPPDPDDHPRRSRSHGTAD